MLPRKVLVFTLITILAMIILPLSMRFRVAGSGPSPRFAAPPKPVRRALLVGINRYFINGDFGNLRGPLKDVDDLGSLLADKKYGFQVQKVTGEQATHKGIVDAFRKYLIADANKDDVCLFFFSGHGTQIKNSASPEEDKLDEALVPFDVKRPVTEKKDVKEIRDKELAGLYNEVLDKGVKLVVIVDSCHSGSSARGLSTGRVKKLDALMTVDMAVPPDPPSKGSKSPEERGALVMAAALDNELAVEVAFDDGVDHGVFCKALVDVLQGSDANKVTVEQLFFNVIGHMRQDVPAQHPTLGKTQDARRKLTLFGDQPAGDPGQTEVTVVVDDLTESLVVQNGRDIGLTRGSEFKRKDGPSVRIRISEEVTELGRAVAEPIPPGKRTDIKTGDVFEQDKWAAAEKPLRVWIPPTALSTDEIQKIALELSKLRTSDKVHWVDDPTEEAATHVISYAENTWQLAGPERMTAKLGAQPTAEAVLKLLSNTGQGKPRLFVYLPPSVEFRNKIKLGEGTPKSAVAVTKTREEALYLLVGRLATNNIEYAWVLPAATQGDARNANDKPQSESLALPPLTDWIDVSATSAKDVTASGAEKDPIKRLENMALLLGKIKGWLALTSPSQTKGHIFPYHLVITNSANSEMKDGGELVECEIYHLALVAEPGTLNPLPKPRYVYVLGLDKSGNSSLIHGGGNDGNRWPTQADLDSGKPPSKISLDNADFIVLGPEGKCGNDSDGKPYGKGILGPETYLLLTTEDPLPLPELLQFNGVRSPEAIARDKARAEEARKKGGVRGGPGAEDLQDLLSGIGGTSFSTRGPTSLNWSVKQFSFRSVEKKQ